MPDDVAGDGWEHEEYLEWIGGSFDPEEFNLEVVNEYPKQVR